MQRFNNNFDLFLLELALIAILFGTPVLINALWPAPTTEPIAPSPSPVVDEVVPAATLEPTPAPTSTPVVDEATPAPTADDTLYLEAIPLSADLQAVTWAACDRYGVPYALALAVMEKESNFQIGADNGRCLGLMQINRSNFSWLADLGIDARSTAGNIEAGCYLLGLHLSDYGDWHKALMAYNMGVGGAAKAWARGNITSAFSRSVVSAADYWQSIIDNS